MEGIGLMKKSDINTKLSFIKEKLLNKKIIIFGTGSVGEDTSKILSSLNLPIEYFVDNNGQRWSTTLHSISIKNPKVLLEENKSEFIVLVASSFYSVIRDQLIEMGFIEGEHFDSVFQIDVDMKSVFTRIYERNEWNDSESASGTGSNKEQTQALVEILPQLFKKYDIHSIIDAPCGDFNWFQSIDIPLASYLGIDIVNELIESNNKNYSNIGRKFLCKNITEDNIPQADLIICRDCFVHLPYKDIFKAIGQFKKSQSTYILTTTFPSSKQNYNIIVGEWRPINLEKEPFSFPSPIEIINENCTEGNGSFSDKSLGLWKLSDIPNFNL